MTKIIISNTNSVSIGFSDEWLYMSLADGRYQGYISRLAYLYREKYRSDTSKLPNFEKILKLINSQDSLRGYRFEAKREKLFYPSLLDFFPPNGTEIPTNPFTVFVLFPKNL